MSLALHTRRSRLLAVRDDIDAFGGGFVHLHGDDQPAHADVPAAQAPLAIVELAAPCTIMHATDALMDLVPAVGSMAMSGQVKWARFVNGVGAAVLDLPAGPPNSGAVVIVSDQKPVPSAQLYSGGQITVTATFSEP